MKKRDEAEYNIRDFKSVLKLYVIEAQDVKPDSQGNSNPLVTVYFGKQKSSTTTQNKTFNPLWNNFIKL